MKTASVPGCCGAIQLYDFGHTVNSAHQVNHTEEEIDKFLKYNIDVYKHRVGMLVVYLNEEQVKKIGQIFTKHGFKKSKPKRHPGHGNNISVLTKNLNE